MNAPSKSKSRRLPPETTPAPLREARWIWPTSAQYDLYNCYALFRKTFELSKVPKKAAFYITADQSYQLYVNGTLVCRGPARGYQSHWPFDEVDIAEHLKTGKNVIAVRAHNPGFSNFQYLSQGYAGLLAAMDVAGKDGIKIVTDNTWKCRRQDGISKNTVPTSLQLFPQEHVDTRIEPPDWAQVDFDDGGWGTTYQAWGYRQRVVWSSLEERMIPLLFERPVLPKKLLGVGSGSCVAGYETTRNVTLTRFQEDMTHKPAEGPGEVVEVPASGKGKFQSVLIDFGKTYVGNLELEITGTQGGEIVDAAHVESITNENLSPDLFHPTHCQTSFGNRLICRKDVTRHAFYHPFGFRYLNIIVRDSSQPLRIKTLLHSTGYPLERRGAFRSSDHDLEKIWECCAWTQQCCSLDAYVDTPWREQAQWWGDARVQGWNTFYFSGDHRLFRRGIHSIAGQRHIDGITYGHAPTMAHDCVLPDFTLIWFLTLWDDYWQTGSLESFLNHQDVIKTSLEYFESWMNPKLGLVEGDSNHWLFLDWAKIFKDGYPTVLNVWLMISLEKLSTMYKLTKKPAEAKRLEKWALIVRKGLSKLIDKDGLLRDGIDRKGKIVPGKSIHSQTLALIANISPKAHDRMISEVILPFITGKSKPECFPSSYWCTYVFTELAKRGYGLEVTDFIKRHWLKMVDHGTTWEGFTVEKGRGSHSHAWSAHPLYHFMQIIGGINQTAPAWTEILFDPCFVGNHGGATVPTPQGPITSEWTKSSSGEIRVQLSLPKGVKARVQLPGMKPSTSSGKKSWVLKA